MHSFSSYLAIFTSVINNYCLPKRNCFIRFMTLALFSNNREKLTPLIKLRGNIFTTILLLVLHQIFSWLWALSFVLTCWTWHKEQHYAHNLVKLHLLVFSFSFLLHVFIAFQENIKLLPLFLGNCLLVSHCLLIRQQWLLSLFAVWGTINCHSRHSTHNLSKWLN